MNKKTNTLPAGTIVKLPARADGIAHRDGNEALWEVVESFDYGVSTLHLVGADETRTCGAATKTLIVVK